MIIDRRGFVAGSAALAAVAGPARATLSGRRRFPENFLWGASVSGYQTEGNMLGSDIWLLEHVTPTMFKQPSGDADNSFELWPTDLDIVKSLGLDAYRFSIEWARIEPAQDEFSVAMLDHYRAMIDGCVARGLRPILTFNHFAAPRWFGALGGWTNPEAPKLFERFCAIAAKHLAEDVAYAVTINEPNLVRMLSTLGLPPQFYAGQRAMLEAAAHATGAAKFTALNTMDPSDLDTVRPILIEGHKRARDAIKSVRPDLPVGVSLAIIDEQAVGRDSKRDLLRDEIYGPWLEAASDDDFIGVQNYERSRVDVNGRLPPPEGSARNFQGAEVYPLSLAGAVRYAHAASGVPVLVTEHGVGTEDDSLRARFIPAALEGLAQVVVEGVPVLGYLHWSLLDNFEWVFGYGPKFGLVAVDRETFARTPKPSAHAYAEWVRAARAG